MAAEAINDWCPCDTLCSLVSERPTQSGDESQCSQHGHYPSSIMSKIDFTDAKDFATSVKRHTKHILIAHGSDANKWPEEVTDEKKSFAHHLSKALDHTKGLPKIRLSLSDATSIDEHGHAVRPAEGGEDLDDAEFACDLLLFPDQLRISHVRKSQVQEFCNALLEFCTGQAQAAKAGANAAASSSSSLSSSSSGVQFPLPTAPLPGVHYLICSHKLRDKRCGVTGPILIDEIDKQISVSYPSSALPTPIHTYKISHIGGHKYAGNVIVYPTGTWYGRVLPCHVPHLLLAHVPAFALVDASTGERQVVTDETTMEQELLKLKPLIRGRVDPL